MPDFSDDPIKYNTETATPNTAGDYSGMVISGDTMGRFTWADVESMIAGLGYVKIADIEAAGYIKADDLPDPYPLDGPQGLARINDSDAADIYGIGFATKQPSGVNSSGPITWFGIQNPAAMNPDQGIVVASFVATNGTAIPATCDIEVGCFPVTTSGGADNLVFTLSETNKVVNMYGSGIGAGAMEGFPATDRNADFRAAGSGTVNWALGVKISEPLPSGCVLDVRCAVRFAAY